MISAQDVIRLLELQPHPIEGGFFRETYRSKLAWPATALPDHQADRSGCTAIYYLLSGTSVSEMHRLPGDEIFHFYLGDPVQMLQLHPDGRAETWRLGTDLAAGELPQRVVPGGVWQGSFRLEGEYGFSLLGATMAPGFDYADYVRGRRADLAARWPAYKEWLTRLTPLG